MPRRRVRRTEDEQIPSRPSPKVKGDEADRSTTAPAGRVQALMHLQQTAGNRYVQRVLGAAPDALVQRVRFGDEDAAALKPAYIQNPNAIEDTQKECREVMKTSLMDLLRQKSQHDQGQEPPSDQALKDTVAQYAKLRLRTEPAIHEFNDERNRVTLGDHKPEALSDKVEDNLINRIKGIKGWHLFGLSIMDAERSVLLAVDNRNPSARRVYWMDRVEGGFRDVTGRLDERITQLTRDLWSAQPPDRRRRTRVSIWQFVPA